MPTLAEALPGLERRAAEAEAALVAAGADSVLTGRSHTAHPDAWAPHYLIMAVPPAKEEQDRLVALARSRYRMAAGYLVAGDLAGATWTWEITEQGRLRAPLLGFDVAAQLLPARQYAAVAELFRAATASAGVGLGKPDPGAAPAAQLVPGAVMPVQVSLLGPVSVRAPGNIEPDRLALATEIVVFLAAHPGGVHRSVLTGAHATGDEGMLRAVVGEVSARAELDEVLPRMAPETESLIDEILPSWRSSVA